MLTPAYLELCLTLYRCGTLPQESFDPIRDGPTKEDLLPKMVFATQHGEFDFQGMYSVLLRHRCVGVGACGWVCMCVATWGYMP